jgi:diaminohydroxyphosphoribosylaminopyrimidine deaminase/5-amino-6-(5-phosphoribosylamino)uracil reductase
MQLRARVDAILIGANTLRSDNPRLTIRLPEGSPEHPQPWRIVLGGSKPLPKDAHLFQDEFRDRTLVFTDHSLPDVLQKLGANQVTSVLIEGGSHVLSAAFDLRLVHEVCFYLAPLLCGGPNLAVAGTGVDRSQAAPFLRNPRYQQIGNDIRCSGIVQYPEKSPLTAAFAASGTHSSSA